MESNPSELAPQFDALSIATLPLGHLICCCVATVNALVKVYWKWLVSLGQ